MPVYIQMYLYGHICVARQEKLKEIPLVATYKDGYAGLLEEKLQNRELKTKGSQEAALGALGNSTLLRKGLLHSGLGGFDKLINLSFLLPRHSCHSKLACTPKRCLFQMQNFSVF